MDDTTFAALSPGLQKILMQCYASLAALKEVQAEMQRAVANSRQQLDQSLDVLQQFPQADRDFRKP